MCTVIYIPTADGCLLSSNRDENPHRQPASQPLLHQHNGFQIISPIDGQAGGTWMGMRNDGAVLILLNGAFQAHERKLPYKQSRGQVVKHLLQAEDILAAYFDIDLKGIEPFSLVLWHRQNLHHFVWDGFEKHHFTPHARQPHIWSSATLYNAAVHERRTKVFDTALEHATTLNRPWLESFLLEAMPSEEENRFVMKRRDYLQTLSIALIETKRDSMLLHYIDLSNRPAQRYDYLLPVTESVQHEYSRLAATVH